MASWSDKLLEFPGYVQEVPVEDYTKVALYKQDQYNQGVARVQSYLDTVNSLPVATEADKAYLNGLSAQYQNIVKGAVSADYSKASLQSQLGTMATKIAKDPVIQNSILSASRIQSLKSSFAELRKTKPEKYAQMNERWVEEKFLQPFYEQGRTQTGLVYNGPTDAPLFTDYRKILGEELKKLDPSIQTTIAPNGEFQYTVDKSSTVSPDRIRQVANSIISSSPDIQQQMEIDGYFAFKNFNSEALFNHIDNTTNVQLRELGQMEKETRDQIDADPTKIALHDKLQEKLKFISDSRVDLGRKRLTYQQNINAGNVDLVKQTLYNDNFRDGMVLQFAKDNHDIEVKTNDAVLQKYRLEIAQSENWLKFVEAGVDPVTRQALDPLNPLYKIHQATQKAKKAGKEDEIPGPEQTVAVPGTVPGDYTADIHTQRIQEVDANLASATQNLKRQYANILGEPFDPTSAEQQRKFSNFQAEQERLYAEGGAVNPDYAEYRRITQVDRATQKVLKQATESIGKEVQAALKNGSVSADPSVLDYLLNSLKTGPGFTSWRANAGVDALDRRLSRFADEKYKEIGKTTSFQATPFALEDVRKNQIKQLIPQAVSTAIGKTESDEIPSAEKVVPISYFNNLDGTVSINYQMDDKSSEIKTVKVPAARNILGNPDPYYNVQQLIELSPDKRTPTDPINALSSYNGKLKFSIIKNPQNGGYQLSLLRNGRVYTVPNSSIVPGQAFAPKNIGSIMERVEQLSLLDPGQLDAAIKTQFAQ